MYTPSFTDGLGPPAERWTKRFDNSGTSNSTLYIGYALFAPQAPVTAGVDPTPVTPPTSSAVWAIQKLSYDGNGLVNLIQWATGGDSNIWDNRVGLTYV